jgi:hypothetical protein
VDDFGEFFLVRAYIASKCNALTAIYNGAKVLTIEKIAESLMPRWRW